MPASTAAAELELDEAFLEHINAIKASLVRVASRHDKLRINKWISALSEPTTQLLWKKNRNLHSFALSDMLSRGKLEHPFTSLPPNPLQNFPTHCNVRITQSFRQPSSSPPPPGSPEEAMTAVPRPHSSASQRSQTSQPDDLAADFGPTKLLQGPEFQSSSRRRSSSAGKHRGFDADTESATRRKESLKQQGSQARPAGTKAKQPPQQEERIEIKTLTFQDANAMSHAELVNRVLQEQAARLRSQSVSNRYASMYGPLPSTEDTEEVELSKDDSLRQSESSITKSKPSTPVRPWDKPKVFTSESERKRHLAEKHRNRIKAEQLASAQRAVHFGNESLSAGKLSKQPTSEAAPRSSAKKSKVSSSEATVEAPERQFDDEEDFLLFLEDFERDILQLTRG